MPMVANQEQPMSGWKTKLGAFLIGIGTVISQSAELFPISEGQPWLKFFGYVIAGIGGAFVTWGVGHKIEKGFSLLGEKVDDKKTVIQKVPYIIKRLKDDETILVRKKRDPHSI